MPAPVSITCHLATLGRVDADVMAEVSAQIPVAGGGTQRLDTLYATSSGFVVDLTLNSSRLAQPGPLSQAAATAADLHQFTQQVTQNPQSRPNGPLANIAVIYTTQLQGHPELRGLMFDMGFISEFEPGGSELNTACPREACAVFLHTIKADRKREEWAGQIAYTTTHELGHVFNLQHSDDECYMRTSPDFENPGDACFQFNSLQQTQLNDCNNRDIYPGGAPFADTSLHTSEDAPALRAQGKAPFRLEIRSPVTEFLPFEPVELDLSLSLKRGASAAETVPSHLDPAYRNFIVWIEDPSGERRRYKSIQHCCDNPATRTVTPDHPIERDISLFGQSGGYTFRKAGDYRVWITWKLGKGIVLQSNTLDLHVRPLLRLSEQSQDLCSRLRAAGRPLFYRTRSWNSREMNALRSLCGDWNPRHWPFAVQMARYARYRMMLEVAAHNPATRRQVRKALSETHRRLRDQAVLGPYRRQRVQDLWDSMP